MSNLTRTPRSRLGLETLEERATPAVTANIWYGDMYLFSDNASDVVEVRQETLWQYGGGNYIPVRVNGQLQYSWFPHQFSGGDIGFYGNGGDDYMNNWTDLNLYAWGGEGNDTLIGDVGDDHLYGEGGHDTLEGWGGNDDLQGGWGLDTIRGGSGRDWVDGGASDGYVDRLYGGSGEDGFAISWYRERDAIYDFDRSLNDWIWYADLA